MQRAAAILVFCWLPACDGGRVTAGPASPPPSLSPVAAPTSTPVAVSAEEMAWAKRNLRYEPGNDDIGEALDFVKKIGPAAEPLLDDLLPLLEQTDDHFCAAVVEAICAIGPKAARAVPALYGVMGRTVTPDPETGRISTSCPDTVGAEIARIGDGALQYAFRFDTSEMTSLTRGREQELLARLRGGGPYMREAAVAMSKADSWVEGVREALMEGHRAGHISDAIFLEAVSWLHGSSGRSPAITVPLSAFEPIVARIAASSMDPAAKRQAARILKLFPHCEPNVRCSPLDSLGLPPEGKATPSPGAKPTPR